MKGKDRKNHRSPFIAIRLWPHHHATKEAVESLIEQFQKYPGCCDEVWFCTEMGFPSLEAHRESAERMAQAAEKMRRVGILPSIQIANTIGHADSAIVPADGIHWQRLVGHDGAVAATCNCPRAPQFLDYLSKMTRFYAAWQPFRVWIDDDLRMDHHAPILWPCFCPVCLATFGREQGQRWSRAGLVRALNRPADGRVRLAWTHFNARSLAGVARAIGAAVHRVAPACQMGLQHAGHALTCYSGPDWRPTFEALAKSSRKPVASRPGHGFYNDQRPRDMIEKALIIADQNARLPSCVNAICPEIENFSHNAMGKTAHGTAVESTLDLAMGCNSLSYAILCSGHESEDWYGRHMLRRLAEWRPFWESYVAHNHYTAPAGLGVAAVPGQAGRRMREDEPLMAWAQPDVSAVYQLAAIGLPLCAARQSTGAFLLHECVAAALTEVEVLGLLSGGVLMDGAACARLQERGFGELLGVSAEPFRCLDSHERLTHDPVNGEFAGFLWYEFFSGPQSPIYRLATTGGKTRILGEYVNKAGAVTGAATVLVETRLGGRLAVLGCNGWQTAISSAKRHQLLGAADWVTRGQMPAWVESAAQAMVVPRQDAWGRLKTVMILNSCIDRTPPLIVRLRNADGGRARWICPGRPPKPLRLRKAGGDRIARIPPLAPWGVGYLFLTR